MDSDRLAREGSNESYDVVVVGGGPGGLSAAYEAARAGLRVLVLERDAAIGEPVRTSGGSFIRPLRRLGVPSSCWWPVRRLRFLGPGREVVKSSRRSIACVLDVRRTYQWLGERAIAAGAQVRLKAFVEGVVQQDGRVAGVRVRDTFRGQHQVGARVVVDASGHTAVVARSAGLRAGNDRSAVGMEWELYAPNYPQDEAILLVGDEIAPGGYGWAFPCGGSRVRLGIGVVRPESTAEPRVLLAKLLDRAPSLARSFEGSSPIELHSGVMPVLPADSARLTGDGVVAVGDAAGQGSTLLGEGIRYAIHAGTLAGRAIVAARGDYSTAGLAEYPRKWRKEMGRDLAICYAANVRVCQYGDADWARALDRVQQLRPGQVAQLLSSHFTVPWALGVLATEPQVVFSVLRAELASRRLGGRQARA